MLSSDMSDLLDSGDGSDFTINCGSTKLNAHQLILATRSPVFKAMLSHDMIEGNTQEVTILDVDPETFRLLLQYIYTSDVRPNSLYFKQVRDLIYAAEKYQLNELKNICFESLTKYISLGNISELAMLAHRYKAPESVRNQIFNYCKT
jgi:speckle-type POZ protein